ncbi:MAG: alanine racemase [Ruminococcaceae bacterium]|nr:alanine racemase [Oscillospiraceae bacterium]
MKTSPHDSAKPPIEYYFYKTTKRAEIDIAALQNNYRACLEKLQQTTPNARIISVVKADGYGHGANTCVCTLLDAGCDFFAVSCLEEAYPVRNQAGDNADILILGYTMPLPQIAGELAKHNFIQTLLSPDYAHELSKVVKKENLAPLRVHIAVDTGMGRIGYPARTEKEIEETVQNILALRDESAFEICGMFTHFARADEELATSKEKTALQAARYRKLKEKLEERGMVIPFHHVSNSAAALTRPDDIFDGVRLGLALYTPPTYKPKRLNLQPVMHLSADIVHIQTVPAGESVGYGGRFKALVDTPVGVLPIGYADGIPRSLRGATLSLKTEKGIYPVKIIGSICMDQCMIDLSGIDAKIGDRVSFFGHTPTALSELAEYAGTIPYELLCAISLRVHRNIIRPQQNKTEK